MIAKYTNDIYKMKAARPINYSKISLYEEYISNFNKLIHAHPENPKNYQDWAVTFTPPRLLVIYENKIVPITIGKYIPATASLDEGIIKDPLYNKNVIVFGNKIGLTFYELGLPDNPNIWLNRGFIAPEKISLSLS